MIYKDIFDFYYLINNCNLDNKKLLKSFNIYIYNDENMRENNKNVLFKDLNLIIVYLIVFGAGLLIVFLMTNYLNNKVSEFTESSLGYIDIE